MSLNEVIRDLVQENSAIIDRLEVDTLNLSQAIQDETKKQEYAILSKSPKITITGQNQVSTTSDAHEIRINHMGEIVDPNYSSYLANFEYEINTQSPDEYQGQSGPESDNNSPNQMAGEIKNLVYNKDRYPEHMNINNQQKYNQQVYESYNQSPDSNENADRDFGGLNINDSNPSLEYEINNAENSEEAEPEVYINNSGTGERTSGNYYSTNSHSSEKSGGLHFAKKPSESRVEGVAKPESEISPYKNDRHQENNLGASGRKFSYSKNVTKDTANIPLKSLG